MGSPTLISSLWGCLPAYTSNTNVEKVYQICSTAPPPKQVSAHTTRVLFFFPLLQCAGKGQTHESCSVRLHCVEIAATLLWAMGVLGKHFPSSLTWRAESLLKHCLKGHLESEIEQMTKWWKKRHIAHFWRKKSEPNPDRISRLIKESVLMRLAHLQFRLTLTPGTGSNLSFPPAAMVLKYLSDKLIAKNLRDVRYCVTGGSPPQERWYVSLKMNRVWVIRLALGPLVMVSG